LSRVYCQGTPSAFCPCESMNESRPNQAVPVVAGHTSGSRAYHGRFGTKCTL